MHRPIRYALGSMALLQLAVASPTEVEAQASGEQHACTLLDPAELRQLTGRKDYGQAPQPSGPPQLRQGTTECDYLSISYTLTANMTKEWFARDRQQTEAATDRWKVQSISGLADEAFYMWDPRPGSDRSVGIVIRAGSKRLSIGELASSDSLDASKSLMLSLAKLALPKLK